MNGQSLAETTHVTVGVPVDNPIGMNDKRAIVTAPTNANVGCPSDRRHHPKDSAGPSLGGKDHTGSRAHARKRRCPGRGGSPVRPQPSPVSSQDESAQILNPHDGTAPPIAATPWNRVGSWPRTVGFSHHRIEANRS